MNETADQPEGVLTYYSLLDIEENATSAEVRKAYFKKAAECHPDKHPDDPSATERFQALSEAYECLKDPTARRDYDTKLRQIRFNPQSSGVGDQHVYRMDSPPSHTYHHQDHSHHYHGRTHEHHSNPSPQFTFFRSSGFFPFPPPPQSLGRGIPPPLAAFMDLMGSLPVPGPIRHGHRHVLWPFGNDTRKMNAPPLMDPFNHPLFRQPLPSFVVPQPPPRPPLPHLRRPHPHLHHPYPPHLAAPTPPMPIRMPIPSPIRPLGGLPGRHRSATYEIKDPTGRTTGFVSHSSSSWSFGMG